MKTFEQKAKKRVPPPRPRHFSAISAFNPSAIVHRTKIHNILHNFHIQNPIIGQPNDEHEREANSIATKITQNPSSEKRSNNTKNSRHINDNHPSEYLNSHFSGGKKLDPCIKQRMEFAFRKNFENIQIHTDNNANKIAERLNARAFTYKNHIFFGKGEFNPHSKKGKYIIAHELAHTIQQRKNKKNIINCYPREVLQEMAFRRGMQDIGSSHSVSPIDIAVIDDSDLTGWLAAFTRTGEVYMTNVKNMVDNVLTAAGNRLIRRLDILDHGNPNGIEIGTDFITLHNISRFEADLKRLNGHFSNNGFVHLQHCEIGQNRLLMSTFAALIGVPVYGGTGTHNPLYRFNWGDYVRCEPSGMCRITGRP